MPHDVIATIKRFITDYRRGSHTSLELVDVTFQTLVDNDASDELVNEVLFLMPDSVISALEQRMGEMVETAFFIPNKRLGDLRSDDEVRRDAFARQPVLRRIHHAFLRLLLLRRYRLEHGW